MSRKRFFLLDRKFKISIFIVPSPVDCPLRNQKINLSAEPYRLPKTTRDGICQTELSLPPNLPKDIEDLLKPYFSQTMNQQQSPVKDCDTTIDHDARDASLRRKLFNETASTSSISEFDEHVELECLSPPPCSPELVRMRRTFSLPIIDSQSQSTFDTYSNATNWTR